MRILFLFSILATLLAFAVCQKELKPSDYQIKRSDDKMSGYTKIGEKYYMIELKEKLSWFGAAHFCRRMDAHLATINSEEEWKELNAYLISQGYGDKHWFWLSANNLETLKKYFWLGTGQEMQYSKWSPGQPDNYRGQEHCAHLWRKEGGFLMNDRKCEEPAHFICEPTAPKTVTITIW